MSKEGKKDKPPITGLPDKFIQYHRNGTFSEELDAYRVVVDDPPSTAVRVHPAKFPGVPHGERVPWCEEGYFLSERPRFNRDPLFHAGAYYVQEASSMAVGSVVGALVKDAESPLKVLDLCAAPGGKSTHLSSVLPDGSMLVSNEAIGKRVPLLMDQVRKWGMPNIMITQADPEQFARQLPESFDLVLVDAPCSGEGLFRKMPEHRSEWSPGMVEHCAMRQKRIVNEAWRSLKEGGILIYCTCTMNPKENEEVLAPLIKSGEASSLRARGADLSAWERTELEDLRYYRSWPQDTGGEGFSMGLLRKEKGDGVGKGPLDRSPSKKKSKGSSKFPEQLRSLLSEPERWHSQERDGAIHLIEKELEENGRQLEGRIPVKWKGTWVATEKGKELLPSPDLALSPIMDRNTYPMSELDGKDALRFIAREPLSPESFPAGWCGITYEGVPLGWVKNLGDRVNGHWPKRWRLTGYDGGAVVDIREE